MALNVGELSAILDLDDSRFNRGIDNAGGGLSGIGAIAGKTGALVGAAMVTAGVAAAGVGAMGVKVAADFQQTNIAFSTMLGSGQKAADFLGKLRNFAAATPFEFPELATAASSLVSVGIDANKVIPIMTSLGNATSGMGTGQEGIKRATVALQQMNAAGRITAEDLNQLRDAGIPVYDLLAAATGKSKEEVAGLAQNGKLGRKELDQLMKALENGKGLERFNGLMDAQSQTLNGVISTLHDTLSNIAIDFITPYLPGMAKRLQGFTNFIQNDVVPGLHSAVSVFGDVASGVKAAVAATSGIADSFMGGFENPHATNNVKGIEGAVLNVGANAGKVAQVVDSFMGGFQNPTAQNNVKGIEGAVLELGEKGGGAFQNLKGQFHDAQAAFQAGLAGGDWAGAGPITAAASTIGSILQDVQKIAGDFFGTVETWVANNQDRFKGWVDTLSGIFTQAVNIVTLAWQAIGVVFDVATGIITNLWDRFGSHLLDHLATAFDAILSVVQGVFEVFQGIFNVFIGVFTGNWTQAWEGVKQIFEGLWNALVGIVSFVINAISTVIGAGMAVISAAWGYAWRAIQGVFSAIWDAALAGVRVGIDAMVSFFSGLGGRISAAASGAFDGLKNAFRSALNWIIEKWNAMSWGLPDFEVLGQKVPGFRIDTPNIPLLAQGGRVVGAGLAVVGEAGPELVNLGRGASVTPLAQGMGSTTVQAEINFYGVQDGSDVLRVLPQLEQSLLAGVGRHG